MKRKALFVLQLFTAVIFLFSITAGFQTGLVSAATIVVTKFEDTNDGVCSPADCSLREAIILANSDPDPDLVQLGSGTYALTLEGVDTFSALGDLNINYSLTITGTGPDTIIDAAAINDRVMYIYDAGAVTLSDLRITNGNTDAQYGAGLYCYGTALTLDSVTIDHNIGPEYGGGLAGVDCTVTMEKTIISDNMAIYGGGGINLTRSNFEINGSIIKDNSCVAGCTGGGLLILSDDTHLSLHETMVTGNTAEYGAGIYMYGDSSTITIEQGLIAGNLAIGEAGGIAAWKGAGLEIRNSTISGNGANTYGGGVNSRIPTTVEHSTIVDNVADADSDDIGNGGGFFCYTSSCVTTIYQSIIADNLDFNTTSMPDCVTWSSGTVNSFGFNLVETPGNCSFTGGGDITGTDPKLAPLADNGGGILTHALLRGSSAIDGGSSIGCPETDQRGFTRPVDGDLDGEAVCDIGAFELDKPYQAYLPLVVK